jgi:hypothetical protein
MAGLSEIPPKRGIIVDFEDDLWLTGLSPDIILTLTPPGFAIRIERAFCMCDLMKRAG